MISYPSDILPASSPATLKPWMSRKNVVKAQTPWSFSVFLSSDCGHHFSKVPGGGGDGDASYWFISLWPIQPQTTRPIWLPELLYANIYAWTHTRFWFTIRSHFSIDQDKPSLGKFWDVLLLSQVAVGFVCFVFLPKHEYGMNKAQIPGCSL